MWLTADLITSVAPSHLCCAGCSWLEPYLDHQALLPGSLMRCNSALCRRRSTCLQHVWWKTKHMLSDAAIINIPDSLTLYWSCNYFVVVRMNGGHLCWNDTRQTSPTFFCYSDLPQNCRKCKVMTSLDIKTHTHKKKVLLTYRPQPPSGSWTERRYLTISFFQASARGILATWHVIRRPEAQKWTPIIGVDRLINRCR